MKEFRELARDRRTLAMLIVLPVLLLVIFGYAANFSIDRISVIVVGPEATSLARELEHDKGAADDLTIVRVAPSEGKADATRLLRDQDADAVIVANKVEATSASDGANSANSDSATSGTTSGTTSAPLSQPPLSERVHVYIDGSGLFTAQAAKEVFVRLAAQDAQDRIGAMQTSVRHALEGVQHTGAAMKTFGEELAKFRVALQRALATGAPMPTPPAMPEALLQGPSSVPNLPDINVTALQSDGLVTVLFNPDLKTSWVMVPGLIGLVRERENGTLEQLAVMPLRPSAIIMGKITPYFLLAVLDMAVVTALGVTLFGVPFVGSLWLFGLAAVVFLFVVLGIGVLISSVSQNTGQAIQMAILFVVPQVLLSGLIFLLSSMPIGVRWIGYILPLTWFREIAQGVMLRGAGLNSLWLPLVILAAMAVVAFGASTARMRYSLTHGGAR
ncbi:ABC transporter permease [Bifidobacterium mongoliense]|uniref:ABC transporter permease n=1 Tax=Bifidobacterium mongoliense TaxID=518643 RepID=UPI001FD379E5|nr:ABC transporter permease [Bifidobacterium mongoliense]